MLDLVVFRPVLSVALPIVSWLFLRWCCSSPRRGVSPWLLALDALPVALGWAMLTGLTARPLLAGVSIATLALVLWLGDGAKQKASGEPLVFTDGLLVSVLLHPSLYAEFLTPWMLIAGVSTAAVLLAGLGSLETPLWGTAWPALAVVVLVVAGWRIRPSATALIGFLSRHGIPAASGDPVQDRLVFGPLATVIIHTATARAERPLLSSRWAPEHNDHRIEASRGTRGFEMDRPSGPIVLMELESFFDARRVGPTVPLGLLHHYDRLAANAVLHGRLTVPAYGANTVRSEFAALTGLSEQVLGLDRFNPYAGFARSRVDSIAWHLRAMGYRTICVHPFDGRFYARARVMPALGFETFLDIAAFEGLESGRRYVPDQAVVDMVTKQLALNGPDTFVFAITMANHSPWSRSAQPAGEAHPDWPVFEGFLKGLGETDAALGRMAAVLSQKPGPALLAAFGDHQPAFPRLFRDLGHSDRTTDYLIWRPEGSTGERRDIAVHDLPGLILRHARSATPTGRELANSVR